MGRAQIGGVVVAVLVGDPDPGGDREAGVDLPGVLREEVQIPVAGVGHRGRRVREQDFRDAVRVVRGHQARPVAVLDVSGGVVREEQAGILHVVHPDLEVVAAGGVGDVVVQDADELGPLLVVGERPQTRAGPARGVEINPRRVRGRIHGRHHRPGDAVVHGLHIREGAVGPDPLPFGLVDPGPGVLGEPHILGVQGVDTAVGSVLQAPLAVADEFVLLREGEVDLRVVVAEDRLFLDLVHGYSRDGPMGQVVVVGDEEPGPIPPERAAHIGVRLPVGEHVVRARSPRFEIGGQVVAHEALAEVVGVEERREVVPPGLDVHHDGVPGPSVFHIGAGVRDVELVDGEAVHVEAESAGREVRVHPVNHDAVLVPEPEGVEARLLGLVGARHIEAAHPDAGRERQHRVRVGGVRHFEDRGLVEGAPEAARFHIHHRGLAGHRHGLRDRRHRKGLVDGEGLAGDDGDILPDDGAEAGKLEGHGVAAGGEPLEAERPVHIGDRDAAAEEGRRFERHIDPGKDEALFVAGHPVEASGSDLREEGHRNERQGKGGDGPQEFALHGGSSSTRGETEDGPRELLRSEQERSFGDFRAARAEPPGRARNANITH